MRVRRRLARRRIVVVGGDILIFDPIMAASIKTDKPRTVQLNGGRSRWGFVLQKSSGFWFNSVTFGGLDVNLILYFNHGSVNSDQAAFAVTTSLLSTPNQRGKKMRCAHKTSSKSLLMHIMNPGPARSCPSTCKKKKILETRGPVYMYIQRGTYRTEAPA
jgi:hypothetical protein